METKLQPQQVTTSVDDIKTRLLNGREFILRTVPSRPEFDKYWELYVALYNRYQEHGLYLEGEAEFRGKIWKLVSLKEGDLL